MTKQEHMTSALGWNIKNALRTKNSNVTVPLNLAFDLFRFLKSKDAIKPQIMKDRDKDVLGYRCGGCGTKITKHAHYCSYCGHEVEWND